MKRALLSVYDKTNIVQFAKALVDLGWELVSTGGTKTLLESENIPVLAVEDVTKFPEILDGRVKTLDPHIHGGILYKRDNESHQKAIEELGISSIDMVVNNLYPFEETVKKEGVSKAEIIENIDIGGPAMLRAAAKNYKDVLVVVDSKDYEEVIDRLKNANDDLEFRERLAAKAFRQTAFYDALIAQYFMQETDNKFPELVTLPYRYNEKMRYGENPHQEAAYYKSPLHDDFHIKQLHGKKISYNNYNDLRANIELLAEFSEPACVAVKHANPSGVALGDSPAQAYQKAFDCDPISIYGGIVGFNREVDLETAELLAKIFLEIIVAPSFSDEALARLSKKKNIRLLECDNINTFAGKKQDVKDTIGGVLLQDKDLAVYGGDVEVVTEAKPDQAEQKQLDFAWKVVKHCVSNAMVLVKDNMTIGLGHGEVRRVWALNSCLERYDLSKEDIKGAVLASDGFFFDDTIELMHEYGIKAVIQPGGSIQDPKVIEKANEYGISVSMTGMRHFKH